MISAYMVIPGKSAFLGLFIFSKGTMAEARTLKLAVPGEKMAQKIAYFHTKETAEASELTKKDLHKQSIPWEKRFCDNCTYYIKQNSEDSFDLGTCKLLPNELVQAKGICNLWKTT